jgi:ABC-type multidrug transport system ATPase subunit
MSAMTLLELEHVSKRYGRGSHERVALRDVSLEIDSGELIAVWGLRRSGRSTLLRVAAGVEPPDKGVVRFTGGDLSERGTETLRGGVRYCRKTFRPADGQHVLDQLITSQLTRGVSLSQARSRAHDALERTGGERCAAFRPSELDHTETARVVIARALTHHPELLVIDEPTLGVDLLDRDRILLLLRSLANESIAVLMSTGETPCLSNSDRALSLGSGELRGELTPSELDDPDQDPREELAPVISLPHVARWSASA